MLFNCSDLGAFPSVHCCIVLYSTSLFFTHSSPLLLESTHNSSVWNHVISSSLTSFNKWSLKSCKMTKWAADAVPQVCNGKSSDGVNARALKYCICYGCIMWSLMFVWQRVCGDMCGCGDVYTLWLNNYIQSVFVCRAVTWTLTKLHPSGKCTHTEAVILSSLKKKIS